MKQPKKKSRGKRIVIVIVAIAVMGTGFLYISSRIKADRNEAKIKTIVLNIIPSKQPATKVMLDLRKPDEELMKKLAEAIKPLLPENPIDRNTGTISYNFDAIQVTEPTLRRYISDFPNGSLKAETRSVGVSDKYYIRYVKDSPKPFRLSSKSFNWRTSTKGPVSEVSDYWWITGNEPLKSSPNNEWKDHCATADYSQFKEMVVRRVFTYCDSEIGKLIALSTSNDKYEKSRLIPIVEKN